MLWVLIRRANICFRGEIRKIFTGYPLLSRPMVLYGKDPITNKILRRNTHGL